MTNPIENFEILLKKNCMKTIQGLYRNKKLPVKQGDRPGDVIKTVCSQLRAIQASETNTNRKVTNNLVKCQKSCFLSVNKLPVYQEVPKQQTTRFDTQCVSDTLLINIIEDAELHNQMGMTDEFETSFKHINADDDRENENTDEGSEEVVQDEKNHIETSSKNVLNNNIDKDNKIDIEFDVLSANRLRIEVSNTSHDKNLKEDECLSSVLDECIELDIDTEIDAAVLERSPSPVFNHKWKIKKSKTPSPLVFNLDVFEKFESLAISMINSCDIEKPARVINSQILGNELRVITDVSTELNEKLTSPVLNTIVKQIHHNDTEAKDFDDLATSKDKRVIIKDHIANKLEDSEGKPMKKDLDNIQKPNEKNSLFLKDEILFSSDEEDEFVNKAKNNIPFTCALESSFSVQSEVLDKTMYVGFQTASNRSIKICTESLVKAKSILSNVTQEDMSLTDMVKLCDNNNIDSGEEKTSKIASQIEGSSKDVEENNRKAANESILKTDHLNGFKTANNTEIKLSEKALAKCREVFKDIDYKDTYEVASTKTEEITNKFDVNSNLKNNCLEELIQTNINDDILIQEFENIEMSLEEDKDVNRGNNILEFKTHSDKSIKISDAELAKPINLLNDIDKGRIYSNKVLNKLQNNPPADFNGFKTASNKQIKISEHALAKTKDLFQDIDFKDCGELETNTLKTSDWEVNDSKKAQTNLNNENRTKNNFDYSSISSTSFGGFKTGNNKDIKISGSSLAKVKNIFKDIDSPHFKYPEKSNDNSIKEENEMEFIKPSTSKTHSNEIYTKNTIPLEGNGPIFQGFKTASNKKVQISKEALTKTKIVFKDIDMSENFEPENKQNASYKDVKEISNESNNPSNKIQVAFQNFNKVNGKDNVPLFEGFQTASNKAVAVSKEALAKTRSIFKDIDVEVSNYTNNKNPQALISPTRIKTTASNGTLKDISSKESKSSFTGFQTASNKSVSISKEALTKSKKIFQDIDKKFERNESLSEDNRNTNKEEEESNKCAIGSTNIGNKIGKEVFVGFQTASNKTVAISKEALAKSKQILHELLPSQAETKSPTNKHADKYNKEENAAEVHKEPDNLTLKGFQMASIKKVDISEEALAKCRKLFQDIDSSNDFDAIKATKVAESSFKGFQTANNKEVKVSDEALAKSRKVFEDININNTQDTIKGITAEKPSNYFSFKTASKQKIKVTDEALTKSKMIMTGQSNEPKNNNSDHLNNIIDTQVLNNFEQSLYTEDFRKTTPIKSKRSGSPILSCPRAKKRKKFEIPYSQQAPKEEIKIEVTKKCNNNIIFDENYKKTKKYTLKDLKPYSDDNKNIDGDLLTHNFDNLLQFQFRDIRNDLSKETITMETVKDMFLDSVNRKLVPNGWIDNHMKLIMWKLISYEVKFPELKTVCTVENVLKQLKYRFDRELYNAERPALRKIFERDDVSTKSLVLCVVGVYEDGVKVNSVANITSNTELLLTDGWYCIKATIDKLLKKLVLDAKITVGTKIVTNGAELINCEQGVAPWEDTSAIRLKISGNSTRRARWDTRLGYHSNAAILSRLSSIKMDGGKVSKLRVFITRVYPALYVEKFEDGSTVTRSERLEHLHQAKYENDRQTLMERLYEEIEKEFYDQDSQDSEEYSDSGIKRSCLDSGTQLAKIMKKSNDPNEFRAQLTSSQTKLLEDHTSKRRDKLLQNIQIKLQEKIEKNGLTTMRNVVPVMKIRVAGVEEKNGSIDVTKGMISIWKPNEAIVEIIKEGIWIDVRNVVPTGIRYSEIQISAGRQSMFSHSKYRQPEKNIPYTKLLKRQCFTIKDLAQNPTMATDYNEIDTVGLVFLIDPSIQEFDSTKQLFQNVYLADPDKNMICVNFWGGLKKFGFENVLDTGQVISCANLQKRAGNTRKNIPQYRVTEFSSFTKTPKFENSRNKVEELSKIFQCLDRIKFCEDCTALKNNYSVFKYQNNEKNSPYRPNNSDYNLSKNKIFIDSPLARQNRFEDFNLTGLDFESTFKQTDTQDLPQEVLLRKKRVNEKISKLKMYGEPPPLSPIHIIHKSKNALNNFKSPLASKDNDQRTCKKENSNFDSSMSVTNVNNTPQKNVELMNRTYVKSVNPVKLNFNVDVSNVSDTVDHFAEDFDGSPPLSLDTI